MIIAVVINLFLLLGYIIYKDVLFSKERDKLIEAILSKDLNEYAQVQKTKTTKPKEDKPSEYVLETDLTDEQFSKRIKEINGE